MLLPYGYRKAQRPELVIVQILGGGATLTSAAPRIPYAR